jgi:hypothetical protein
MAGFEALPNIACRGLDADRAAKEAGVTQGVIGKSFSTKLLTFFSLRSAI